MRDPRRRLVVSPLLLLVALVTILTAGTVSASAAHGSGTRVRAIDSAVVERVAQASSERPASVGCLRPSQPGLASGSCVATEAGGARFVVNSAGDALDTARVTIPGGKYSYLLENPSKSGVFADSMGFNQASLDSALRSHLVDNFGTATPSVSMVGGGTKFSVTGPMVGPSGAKWTITTAWGVDVDGTIRLITATP